MEVLLFVYTGSETFGAFDEMFTEYLLMLTLE